MISRETIEEIKNRVDIVDVIGDFVTLKKSGSNYKALSPFVNEKTPSFFVVPAKGFFKDFSSGKGGDAFAFIMEHEKISYLEAIRYLAKKYGIEIKEDGTTLEEQSQSEREGLYILMNFAKEYYKNMLIGQDVEEVEVALSYLYKERRFNKAIIEKFDIGYALPGWDHFIKEALAKGYNQDLLEKTGLIVKKENGHTYDRFRERIIFPIHNILGKTIAFGARVLGKEKDQPKYINSPETDIYHKSDVLYGLYQAKNSIRQKNNCYLVEGYTDVVSMHHAGVDNVVSTSGTAMSEQQVKLVQRFTENLTVLFDGDTAGIKAALRGIDLILKTGLNVRVVLLPPGEDPDSYSQKIGTSAFQEYLLSQTQDFVSFKAKLLIQDIAQDPIRKAEAIKEIITSIALIPDSIKRSVYVKQTSDYFNIHESVLLGEINKAFSHEKNKRKTTTQPTEVANETDSLSTVPQHSVTNDSLNKVDIATMIYYQERETIRLLLNYANQHLEDQSLSDYFVHELDDVEFKNETFKEIFNIFRQETNNGNKLDIHTFISTDNEEIKNVVTELITPRYGASQNWQDKFDIFFETEETILKEMALTNVLRLKFRIVQKMIEDNLIQIKQLEQKNDFENLDKSLLIQTGLKKAESELANQLGIVISK